MRIILASAAAALALAATPAAANPETVEIRVSTAGLNLGTAAGRAALEERVEREARKACKTETALDRTAARTDWECVDAAKAAVMTQVARAGESRGVAMAAE